LYFTIYSSRVFNSNPPERKTELIPDFESPACETMHKNKESTRMSNLAEGLAAFEAEDYIKAFDLLKPMAEQGHAEAQCILANMCHLGLGREGNDPEAVEWYRRASEQGYGVATNNLAGIFLQGQCGVVPDRVEAERLYHRAREQGFLHAPS